MPVEVKRDDVQKMVEGGAQLVEVLPRESYEKWHLPGAMNIPITELDDKSALQLDKYRPVIVYCADTQ